MPDQEKAGNVSSLFGGPTGQPEPNENCIATLREWLEMAEAGEVVGIAIAGLCHDRTSRYAVSGISGGYGMVGALEIAKADLIDINREEG